MSTSGDVVLVAFLSSEPNQTSTGAGACELSGLGTIRANFRKTSHIEQYTQIVEIEKAQLKAVQRKITTLQSMCSCCSAPIPMREEIECHVREKGGGWSGLQTCKSKFCVNCHPKRRIEQIDRADRALHEVEKKGGSIAMFALTCSNVDVSLLSQVEALQSTFNLVMKRRKLLRHLKSYGYIGYVSSLEIQIHCDKGSFHPHRHVAFAFEKKLTREGLEEMVRLISEYWCKTMKKKGFYALRSQQHGTIATSDSGKYVAKGAAQEIVNSMIKRGANGSVSWIGLLYSIAEERDVDRRERLIKLYKHLEVSVGKKRTFTISPRLDQLGKEVECENDEDCEGDELEEDSSEEVIVVPLELYNELRTLSVSHLVPQLLYEDLNLRSKFKEMCASQLEVRELTSGSFICDDFVRSELLKLFDLLAHKTLWEQSRILGVF